jgi:CheY-like chemotaxis protein
MTLERKKVLRYGVALDAVVLVTGIALNFSDIPALVIVAMFTAAVAIGAWRGGWGPAIAGLVLSFVSTLVFFRASMPAGMLALLALGGVGGAWVGVSARRGSSNSESIIPAGDAEPTRLFDPAFFDKAEDDATARDFLLDQELPGVESAEAAETLDSASSDPTAPAALETVAEFPAESLARPALEREIEEPALEPQPLQSDERELHVLRQSDAAPAVVRSAVLSSSLVSASSEDEESNGLLEDRLAANRALIEKALNERVERQGQSDRLLFERLATERLATEREQAEREFQDRLTSERAAIQSRLAERLASERATMEREAALRLEQERRAVQESIARQFDSDRSALTKRPVPTMVPSPSNPAVPSRLTSEPLVEPSDADSTSLAGSALRAAPATMAPPQTQTLPPFAGDPQTIMTARGPIPKRPVSTMPARPEPVGLFGSLWSGASGLFGRRGGSRPSVNLRPRGPTPPPRVTAVKSPPPAEPRRPRLLLIERRRAMADTVLPELRARGIDAEVVERWIDAIDEMFRFMPDALLVDIEIPEYERLLESLTGPSSALPVFLTGRSRPSAGQVERIPNAGFLTRPYDADELERAAQQFSHRSRAGVRRIAVPLPTREPDDPDEGDLAPLPRAEDAGMTEPARPSSPIPSAEPRLFLPADGHEGPAVAAADAADYIVECFNCRGIYDAMEAEWCSCLTRERSLVCANCLTCFCKAPPAYKERFWLEAPASLFERKTAELKRHKSPAPNPSPDFVTRPLVLLVEDDEDIQRIVERVTAKLGYGFIAAANGLDGLSLARLYKPDLILSDAFMPKLDGREMCRILRDEPGFEQCRMVVMTGLYTDTKYKSEALRRFKVDEYLAKPVAINDLVALLQRYLDGRDVKITKQPPSLPEVAKAQPQVTINDLDEWPEESIALSELMADSEQNTDEVGFEILESTSPPFQLPELRLELESTEALPKPEAEPEQSTYEVCCFSCAELFDAAHAEWCTCLGHDQTLVCPECGNCFCKAPSLYKERFWMDAPSILFERKTLGSRRSPTSSENPSPDDVKRPLILLVEDDENIHLIVRTVVTTLGYGFVVAADGQEGLAMARTYKPELVLSDAFMPKLDGREMCRLLKADPATAHAKAIIVTGLYTDRKYRNEAFDYFKVDDYVAKPLAVSDLLQLLRKHLPAEVRPTM